MPCTPLYSEQMNLMKRGREGEAHGSYLLRKIFISPFLSVYISEQSERTACSLYCTCWFAVILSPPGFLHGQMQIPIHHQPWLSPGAAVRG